ncbi:MAG TPA: hypothetical protein VL992_13820, partial [Tepidisphaeraceae bacterium]|nr:hypothetical protein [Tepidisphaeraceae bacterium]
KSRRVAGCGAPAESSNGFDIVSLGTKDRGTGPLIVAGQLKIRSIDNQPSTEIRRQHSSHSFHEQSRLAWFSI